MKIRTLITLFLGFSLMTSAQETRSYNGTGNNIAYPDWGAVNTNLLRLTEVDYADGVFMPGGQNRPNPRAVSNALFQQDALHNDQREH